MADSIRLPRLALFIGNEWIAAADGATFDVITPADGALAGRAAAASPADVDAAVHAAHTAFPGWAATDGAARGRLLWRLADLVEEHLEEIARLEAVDVGRPLGETLHGEIPLVADTFRHFAGWADKLTGSTFALPQVFGGDRLTYTLRRPLGVIGAITPWNAPTMITSWKLAPALAAGNTVVLKPAEDASLTALRLAELALEAGFPPGVINVVTGLGAVAGDALVRHPLVAKVTFTGSTVVGRRIGALAGEALKRVDLELGGKSPQLIWPDADLDAAAATAAASFLFNQGQVCASTARVYVHRDVFDEVASRVVARAGSVAIGDPLADGTELGSLISQRQLTRVLRYIDGAKAEGATLLAGGTQVDRPGFFVRPTVFSGTDTLTIAREEVFGPVGLLIPFDDDDEALRAANQTEYGLVAVIWTNDAARINRFTRDLEAGVVWVNAWGPPHPAVPWLGIKASGVGEELGLAGLHANTRLKTVNVISPNSR